MNSFVKGLSVAALGFALTAPVAQADQFVRMVSGPSGGSWYPLGAKIMQVFDEKIDGITTSNTSGGGISNVLSVNGGDAEIGWSYAHTAFNGFSGKGKFKKAQPDVRHFDFLVCSFKSCFGMKSRPDY